ncbi:hypothetical protein os4_28130 [Comamonadaceae bacterium OS-4]|nr:hypothetical protein os4_28130 [Comamonadaceae bacterium OS-4]
MKAGIASAIDQALLSALNLAISFAFIRFAAKDEYGIYLLLMTPLYLALGVQNALVLSPIATVFPSAPEKDKDTVYATAVGAQFLFVSASAVIGSIGLAAYWYFVHGEVNAVLIVGFGLAIAGLCTREGARTLFYTRNNAVGALKSDFIYALGLTIAIGVLCYFQILKSDNALLATGIAALWPYINRYSKLSLFLLDKEVLLKFWACGRWALIGVLVTWINLNAYPLIVGISLSTEAVADINVARLFLMPVGLCVTAWANLYRPQISGWASQNQMKKIKQITLKSLLWGLLLLGIFTLAVAEAYPYIQILLGSNYHGLLPLVVLWSVFFGVSLVRNMLMATLMTEPNGYRELQSVSWFALIVSMSGLWIFSSKGAGWVIGVLIAVEAVQLILIGIKANRRWSVTNLGTPNV